MVARCVRYSSVGRSCSLQKAEGKRVHFVRYSFGFDFSVHHNAAAYAVTIALRHDISHDRRLGERELQRPRQACSLNKPRVTIDVEIADVGHGPWWSEDLVRQALRVVR